MRVSVTVMDDQGRTYGGEANLQAVEGDAVVMSLQEAQKGFHGEIDFDLPVRPFVKKYSAGMSGPKRFVLLLAHMTHGTTGTPVHVSEVQRLWNTMVGLMDGTFNSAYPTRAKDNGWADATGPGVYVLLPGWMEIL